MTTITPTTPAVLTGGSAAALRCPGCADEWPLQARHRCHRCGRPLEVAYDPDRLADVDRDRIAAGPRTIWRYRDLLPCAPATDAAPGLPTGLTPLLPAPRLAAALGLRDVWVKNEAANPTHSYKDRVVSVALEAAAQLGFRTVACASTGNLANALAAHASASGLDSRVFVPADLEPAKLTASAVYDTTVYGVDGTYDQVDRLCRDLAARHPWAVVNVNLWPYYSEGSSTVAYEIAEQLHWRAPDRCVVPVGTGALYHRIHRGFARLAALGLVDGDVPVMDGAQAAGCAPVAAAWRAGEVAHRPVRPDTLARSIAVGDPPEGVAALQTARDTGGRITAVPEHEIAEGIRLLARTTGIFTETAGGVATSALARLARAGHIDPDERVVLCITGDGLKTPDAVAGGADVVPIAARVDAVRI